MDSNYFVYILQCKDGTYYTGYTNNVEKRVMMHQAGKGAKYTRGRTPVKLVFQKRFPTKEEAMSAEYQIKRFSREQKELLIQEGSGTYVATKKL
ncbi:GIY-YIG nuclease family protein [Fictibacillus sp. Mic-4]|uniref:GIY-YIG nuclease family protein n=1 Tax=Fictibacillus sp. Mic-4 TaxID=3132826 RepID=UPI003CF9A11A